MLDKIFCTFLNEYIEFSQDRIDHILERHPEMDKILKEKIVFVISDPDIILKSSKTDSGMLFSKWFSDVLFGKYVVVVILSEEKKRHWIVTSYITRRLSQGEIIWKKN